MDYKILIWFAICFIQAIYDFLGWGIWLNESPDKLWKKYFFRTAKFILDYPVTLYIMCSLGMPKNYIIAFYVFKQSGGIDWIYKTIGDDLILKRHWSNSEITWLFWTPVGWVMSIIETVQNMYLTKGHVTKNWFYAEVTAGFILAILIAGGVI